MFLCAMSKAKVQKKSSNSHQINHHKSIFCKKEKAKIFSLHWLRINYEEYKTKEVKWTFTSNILWVSPCCKYYPIYFYKRNFFRGKNNYCYYQVLLVYFWSHLCNSFPPNYSIKCNILYQSVYFLYMTWYQASIT